MDDEKRKERKGERREMQQGQLRALKEAPRRGMNSRAPPGGHDAYVLGPSVSLLCACHV